MSVLILKHSSLQTEKMHTLNHHAPQASWKVDENHLEQSLACKVPLCVKPSIYTPPKNFTGLFFSIKNKASILDIVRATASKQRLHLFLIFFPQAQNARLVYIFEEFSGGIKNTDSGSGQVCLTVPQPDPLLNVNFQAIHLTSKPHFVNLYTGVIITPTPLGEFDK